MSAFSISLDNEVFESEGDLMVSGSLKIGDFREDFHASLSYWNRDDYLSQWKDALNRLSQGERRSAIVTAMYDPKTANFIFWWVMYLNGDVVYIQNQVLFLEELERPFYESELYSFIPERETHTEEGEPISEWVIGISAIKECVDSM